MEGHFGSPRRVEESPPGAVPAVRRAALVLVRSLRAHAAGSACFFFLERWNSATVASHEARNFRFIDACAERGVLLHSQRIRI